MTRVATDLIGNGAAPEDLLELDREAIFTRPDRTREHADDAQRATASRRCRRTVTLRGNLYVRASDVDTLNGDDSDFEECEDTPGFICEEEGDDEEIVLDENGEPIAADDELEGATVNRTSTEQNGSGFGLQAASRATSAAARTASRSALAHDESRRRVRREHRARRARRDAARRARRRVRRRSLHGPRGIDREHGLYLTNTFTLGERAALTVSGRYNRTQVVLEDQIDDDLDGDHTFQRFNPAVGLTWARTPSTFYAGYSEASRAPSPVELTCADEDDPCRLPNAFVADPPLEQVVAKTFEAGVRGASAAAAGMPACSARRTTTTSYSSARAR